MQKKPPVLLVHDMPHGKMLPLRQALHEALEGDVDAHGKSPFSPRLPDGACVAVIDVAPERRLSALQAVKESHPDAVLLLLADFGDGSAERACLQGMADDCLMKPFTPQRLQVTLRNLLSVMRMQMALTNSAQATPRAPSRAALAH